MKYRAEFRDTTGRCEFVEVELDTGETASVETARARGQQEADVLGYAYAQRRAYAAAPAGFSLFSAEPLT